MHWERAHSYTAGKQLVKPQISGLCKSVAREQQAHSHRYLCITTSDYSPSNLVHSSSLPLSLSLRVCDLHTHCIYRLLLHRPSSTPNTLIKVVSLEACTAPFLPAAAPQVLEQGPNGQPFSVVLLQTSFAHCPFALLLRRLLSSLSLSSLSWVLGTNPPRDFSSASSAGARG